MTIEVLLKNTLDPAHIAHLPSDISAYRMFGLDYYDAILLSGEYQGKQIRKLEELRNLPEKDIEYVGLPYMDVMLDRVKKAEKPKEHDTTVIVAPSWGDNGLLSKYGSDLLDKLVETGYKIIIRPHPQSFTAEKEMIEELQKKYPDSDQISWNRDTDNFDALYNSDVMISDFSGVIFDYSLIFDKPVIYTEPDFNSSIYDCAWLDEELWTFKVLPTIGIELSKEDFGNIEEVINACIESKEYFEGREKAREETWMHLGEGRERVVDYLEKTLIKFDDELKENQIKEQVDSKNEVDEENFEEEDE